MQVSTVQPFIFSTFNSSTFRLVSTFDVSTFHNFQHFNFKLSTFQLFNFELTIYICNGGGCVGSWKVEHVEKSIFSSLTFRLWTNNWTLEMLKNSSLLKFSSFKCQCSMFGGKMKVSTFQHFIFPIFNFAKFQLVSTFDFSAFQHFNFQLFNCSTFQFWTYYLYL